MTNIWEIILQAVSVSVTAGMILVVKRFLSDKLSPRWQYYVWMILAVRIIIPANTVSFILQPVPLWIETLKGYVEGDLTSAFTEVYEIISPFIGIPVLTGDPKSITDIIFTVIFAGMIIMLLYYLYSYIRLKNILKGGEEISGEMREIVDSVSAKYALRSCRAVMVHGIDSAFVTGVIKPVLAVPYGKITDEKIILHELMHLKYCDVLQNIFLSVLKAINWYNPFMQYVFNIIGNDMESLCDQRVLEVLEGEERREYGKVLLEMANEKYSRAVGTSSLSNGGKNISRRIEAIVRFKKYPKGMALVSVCIVIIMLFSVIGGSVKVYSYEDYNLHFANIKKAMATARTNRATTVAGAIDVYAKGLILKNSVMIASVSPLEEHENMEQTMRQKPNDETYLYDSGRELDFVNISEGYRIFNLKCIDEENYEAMLMFHTNGLYAEDGEGMLMDDDGDPFGKCAVAVKIRIYYDDGWCVKEYGERRTETNFLNLYQPPFDIVDAIQDMSAESPYGTVRIRSYVQYSINNTIQNTNDLWNSAYFNKNPMSGAMFSGATVRFYCEYDSNTRTTSESPQYTYGIQLIPVDSPDEEVQWPDTQMTSPVSGTSSDGFNWQVDRVSEWDEELAEISESWRDYYGKVQSGSSGSVKFDAVTGDVELHDIYRVRIFWDGEAVDELTVTEAK